MEVVRYDGAGKYELQTLKTTSGTLPGARARTSTRELQAFRQLGSGEA